jgi:hypothetical protein
MRIQLLIAAIAVFAACTSAISQEPVQEPVNEPKPVPIDQYVEELKDAFPNSRIITAHIHGIDKDGKVFSDFYPLPEGVTQATRGQKILSVAVNQPCSYPIIHSYGSGAYWYKWCYETIQVAHRDLYYYYSGTLSRIASHTFACNVTGDRASMTDKVRTAICGP